MACGDSIDWVVMEGLSGKERCELRSGAGQGVGGEGAGGGFPRRGQSSIPKAGFLHSRDRRQARMWLEN